MLAVLQILCIHIGTNGYPQPPPQKPTSGRTLKQAPTQMKLKRTATNKSVRR